MDIMASRSPSLGQAHRTEALAIAFPPSSCLPWTVEESFLINDGTRVRHFVLVLPYHIAKPPNMYGRLYEAISPLRHLLCVPGMYDRYMWETPKGHLGLLTRRLRSKSSIENGNALSFNGTVPPCRYS